MYGTVREMESAFFFPLGKGVHKGMAVRQGRMNPRLFPGLLQPPSNLLSCSTPGIILGGNLGEKRSSQNSEIVHICALLKLILGQSVDL